MPVLALVLYATFIALALVLRSILQFRRTGSSGFRGISGRAGSPEWLGGVLFVLAFVGGVTAPVLDLAGASDPIEALDERAIQWVGMALFAIGLAATLVAQAAMGRSWRIGVDAQERTELVVDGPFQLVRNPIFASMLPAFLGLVLLVPNVPALVSFAALAAALEIQTRLVEEPYLLQTHGERYGSYARAVGRFFPGIGRLRRNPDAQTSLPG
jgi:protein-S-isoprenylcysteine O-methyltransferase Ste14